MATITIDPDLATALKKLKLGQVIASLPERLALARKTKMSHEEQMPVVLRDEIDRRESTATTRRARNAGLDPYMMLERWDDSAKVTYDHKVLGEISTLRFIESRRNVVILGPVGVGKTFLATAKGHIACRHRFGVHLTRADDMLRRLKQSRLDNSRDALMTELCTSDLLIIDDFALEPMTRDESRDICRRHVGACGPSDVTANVDPGMLRPRSSDHLLVPSP